MKKTVFTLYTAVIAIMAAATVYEKYEGTERAHEAIYGSWWFCLTWGLLAAAAVLYIIRQRMRRPSLVALHLSLVVILAGALITHLFSWQGVVHLRMNETTDTYFVQDHDVPGGVAERPLPFRMRLVDFRIDYHHGTEAAANYTSLFTILPTREEVASEADEKARTTHGEVSMNRIFQHNSIRFTQMSYDPDLRGSNIQMNSDPYGIAVTYTGYALLFFALFWMLLDPRGSYRQLLRSPLLKRGVMVVCVLAAPMWPGHTVDVRAATTLPQDVAQRFGQLFISYNGRICPVQTYAIDFTKKLYGKPRYRDYTAEQVLLGFIFWPKEWASEPIVRVKGGALKTQWQLGDYCSVNTFFNAAAGDYTLGPLVQEYVRGNHDKLHEQAAQIDDKLMLVMQLSRGTPLALFPAYGKKRAEGMTAEAPKMVTPTEDQRTLTWFAPSDSLPARMPAPQKAFIQGIFTLLYEKAMVIDHGGMMQLIDKMARYQQRYGASSLPSPLRVKAERLNNRIPFATLLFMVCLSMGLLTMLHSMRRMMRVAYTPETARQWLAVSRFMRISIGVMAMAFLVLTFALALRWMVSGRIPMANGYETMLTVAWMTMMVSLAAVRRFHIVLSFGFLLSGFFLLVSHISQMDPAITPVMPVLNSPLLTIHVSVIMMSYALLALTFICGVTAIALHLLHRNNTAPQEEALQALSRLFLYPALTTMGLGIFIGAIWANISWGQYWSWDPKETWALITLMVYAVVVHTHTLPVFRRPIAYHIYIILAFLSILMTYFGVNYILGGMHSYA